VQTLTTEKQEVQAGFNQQMGLNKDLNNSFSGILESFEDALEKLKGRNLHPLLKKSDQDASVLDIYLPED
jgi:hypothetical protein